MAENRMNVKYVVDMEIYGCGSARAYVEAPTIPEAKKHVQTCADSNQVEIEITGVIPWEDFLTEDFGLTFIPFR